MVKAELSLFDQEKPIAVIHFSGTHYVSFHVSTVEANQLAEKLTDLARNVQERRLGATGQGE